MSKARLAIVILVALAAAAGSASLTPYQQQTLTPIDTVWSKAQLESVPAPYTVSQTDLQATAADGSASAGLRLRAIHALSTYCAVQAGSACPDNDPAHLTLTGLIASNGSAQNGADLLILRGAVESLGPMRDPNDAAMLTALLNHPSRDIRATSALALGALCNTSSNTLQALHQRLTNESTDQVKLAISAALRMLSACP
jgi:hypothetical protein